jgi:plasmid stabilization system protein ParE
MYELKITPRAQKRILQLKDYLLSEWNSSVYNAFVAELNHCLNIIEENPYSFALTDISNVRRCTVTPLNSLYYTIEGTIVLILSIEDSRMNPSSM